MLKFKKLLSNILTKNEVQLGFCLEGIVKCDKEWRLANVLQHLPLGPRVFCSLGLLYNSGLLQNLHGIKLSCIMATDFSHEEYLSICWQENNHRQGKVQ